MIKGIEFNCSLAMTEARTDGALFKKEELEAIAPDVEAANQRIEEGRGRPELAFLDLPYAYTPRANDRFGGQLVEARSIIARAAEKIRSMEADFLHVAIGGSALGSIALRDALSALPEPGRGRIFIPDNIDPELIASTLGQLRPDRTFLHVVSKSGDTVETIANFAIAYDFLRRSGVSAEALRERVYLTTNPARGGLREIADSYGFQVVPLPDEIHGRFSVLSPSGLFGAAVGGVDLDDLLAGAREADEAISKAEFWQNPAQLLAALHFLGDRNKGLRCLILLPYAQALRTIGDWYSQLVAESLGKNGVGVTPVKALGATDQHSQLQLYNEGPHDKLLVFFGVRRYRSEVKIPNVFSAQPGFEFLGGHSLNELIDAERRGTAASLYAHEVPSCEFMLDGISPANLAALFIILERAVCILGELYGVNAFNQPGVEESKEFARAMLGKNGESYDKLREEVAKLEQYAALGTRA